MSFKSECTASTSGESSVKKRKVIGLEEKLAIISEFESGVIKCKISRDHALSESTVRTILKNTNFYKEKQQSAVSPSNFHSTRNRSTTMIKMERLLSIWIEDCNQKNIPLNKMSIRTKAVSLFAAIQTKRKEKNEIVGETNEKFCGSSGWFAKFRKRCEVHNLMVVGVVSGASVDDSATTATKYPAILNHQVKEESSNDGQDGGDDAETQTKECSINEIDAIFRIFEDGKQMIMDADPNVERAMYVTRQVDRALSCYRVLYKEKKLKQTSLLQFFKKQ